MLRRHSLRTISALAAFALLVAGAAGCGGRADAPAEAERPAAATERPTAETSDADARGGPHAEGIVPGSYADWCEEHGVPETACTRCDASLIAAFKATGDWCDEHGLPRSQCATCDPALRIVRPPKPAEVQ